MTFFECLSKAVGQVPRYSPLGNLAFLNVKRTRRPTRTCPLLPAHQELTGVIIKSVKLHPSVSR
jgi:hypothetical protein